MSTSPQTSESADMPAPRKRSPKDPRRNPSREGKVNISGWLDPEYRAGCFAVRSIKPRMQMQDVLEEALRDLFTKYGVDPWR